MALFGWLNRSGHGARREREHWRREWTAAAQTRDRDAVARLLASLESLRPRADDVEVEEEMLDALSRLVELADQIAVSGLPRIDTTHRVIGADTCHFTAPASMPDEPAQPGGRLLLTSRRLLFVGGAAHTTLPWHAAGEITQAERDLVVIRGDRQNLYRFRCNNYGDALCAAEIARQLGTARRRTV
jgi:hypothetical protein